MFRKIDLSQKTKRLSIALLISIVGLLSVITIAYAVYRTINTNDGAVDSNWGNPIYTSTCTNSSINDRDEIKNGWIANDADNYYFRIQACADTQRALSDDNHRAVAGFDCNNDGDVTDPYVTGPDGDRVVVYLPGDLVLLYDGGGNILAGEGANAGEFAPTNPGNNIEWSVPIADIYAACHGETHIGLGTIIGTGQVVDQTPLYGWKTPTAVTMQSFQTKQNSAIGILPWIVLAAIGGLGLFYIRRRKNI